MRIAKVLIVIAIFLVTAMLIARVLELIHQQGHVKGSDASVGANNRSTI